MREEFEKWLISTGEYAESQNGIYLSPVANISWDAWQASRAAIEPPAQKLLIGWRMADYTEETTDPEMARNWAMAVGVLPIFEGDVNTSLTTSHGIRIKGKAE